MELAELRSMIAETSHDWSVHRQECSSRDAENKRMFGEIKDILDGIAPWAVANIEREKQRAEAWKKMKHLAVSEVTRIVVKGALWMVLGLIVLWLANTPLGHLVTTAVRLSAVGSGDH